MSITWEQVLALDPAGLAGVPAAAAAAAVAAANDLPSSEWATEARADRARLYRAAHDAALALEAGASVGGLRPASRTLGPGSESFQAGPASGASPYESTAWGRLYLQMVRTNARARIPGGL